MKKQNININVSECERHCSDNYNNPNMCYDDITEDYRSCKPEEYQCVFYVKQLEETIKKLEQYKKSKQASYESIQKLWQDAIKQLRGQKEYNNLLTYNINKFQDGIRQIRILLDLRKTGVVSDTYILNDIEKLIKEDKDVK